MRLIDADKIRYRDMSDGRVPAGVWYTFMDDIQKQSTVDAIPVIRCKDCKYFELNHLENVNGIPLIVAHEICTKWGDGCKTTSDGYCFLAERKEE